MKKLCPDCETLLKPYSDGWGCCPKCGWLAHLSLALSHPYVPPMSLPYVSIDLETTGLDPSTCQVLEFGAVFDDWTKTLNQLPQFHRYIVHDRIVGEPYALQMNAKILKSLAYYRKGEPGFCAITDLARQFSDWLFLDCGWSGKITAAGKNFATFDLQFLKPHGFDGLFHHRVLDPATLFWRADDEKLPDSKTCMQRAGVDGEVAHTAVEDALAVVQMIRAAAKRLA